MLAAGVAAAAVAPMIAAPFFAHAEAARPTPPTLDELLAEPHLRDAAISPDGEQLAILRTQPAGDKATAFVTLSRMSDLSAQPALVKLGEHSAEKVEWANNERLLIWLTFDRDDRGRLYGIDFYGTFVPIPIRRVVSVDLRGENSVVMFSGSPSVLRRGYDASRVIDYMQDDPRRILMQAWNEGLGGYALYAVDVYTGEAELVEQGAPATDTWLTQGGVPMLRMDSNARGTVAWVYGRAPGEKDWKLVRRSRFDAERKLPDFDVVGPTPKAGVFLVSQRPEGRDTRVIRAFDIATLQFGEVVAETPGRDLEGAFVDEGQRLVASAYWDDRLSYQFADPALAPHFKAVNAALKNACNLQLYDIDTAHRRMLFRITGPQEPGAFVVYDRERKALEYVGHAKPWLAAARLARTEALTVKTRDGAGITAYLTTPVDAGGGPLPMVVMPHGGPELRDYLDWDVAAQALAARGWLVLQPNFRGSGGYGKAFADLGRRQWGERMQADVEDAVDQVVASGRADPRRLAIYGTSFGGYSALMGAVRRPGAYRAVVSVAGDADLIDTLAFSRREDGADSPAYAYWRASIGDPKADADMLVRASPARRAAEIQAPVLLIHGDRDTIVDPKQSRTMAKALKAAGKPYELVELKNEGHTNWDPATWKTVLEKVTGFIGERI